MGKMLVKVCGMRDADNIREVERLGIDWMGFVFYPQSSRFVSEIPSYLPSEVRRVGVFVDADPEYVRQTVQEYSLDIVQLHGHESAEQVCVLRSILPAGTKVMKAFNVESKTDLVQLKKYEGTADYYLFDTKASLAGGNGTKFDWDILSHYDGSTPFLLSGGIGPGDAELVRSFSHPMFMGVDLNSRFESAPAVKDAGLLRRFFYDLNKA